MENTVTENGSADTSHDEIRDDTSTTDESSSAADGNTEALVDAEDPTVAELRRKIELTSKFFTAMLDYIPSKFYVENPDAEANPGQGQGRQGKKKTKTVLLNKKLLAKKAKLLKLDPKQHKTIPELQAEIERREAEMLNGDSTSDGTVNLPAADNTYAKPIRVSELPSASIDELRTKLHAKMASLRGKRKIMDDSEHTKVKKSRSEKKEQEKKTKKEKKASERIKKVSTVEDASVCAVRNDKGEVVFSRFDFKKDTETGKHQPKTKKKKKTAGETSDPPKTKNMSKLLNIAEKKQEKIKQLKKTDDAEAKEMLSAMAWGNALQKAEGVKLKDDPKLIRNSIKRLDKQKQKSKKAWDERTETVANQQAEKQKKRKQNLLDRKAGKHNTKGGAKNKPNNKKKVDGKKSKSKPGF